MDFLSIAFCPSCGENVDQIEIMDIRAEGFRCPNGHYLHNLKSGVFTSQTMGNFLELTSGKESPEDILKEWLCNSRLRDHLNDNLAGIVRFVLDKNNGRKTIQSSLKYTYCPLCGEVLQDVTPKSELYEAHLNCRSGHTFLCRGGIRAAGSKANLRFDYDERYFRMSYKSWTEDKHFSDYIPHEIRKALLSLVPNTTTGKNDE